VIFNHGRIVAPDTSTKVDYEWVEQEPTMMVSYARLSRLAQ